MPVAARRDAPARRRRRQCGLGQCPVDGRIGVARLSAWPRNAFSGAARHRALDRGGARGLPALHLDRRRRDAVGRRRASSRARRATVSLVGQVVGHADGRRARRRSALQAAGHRGIAPRRRVAVVYTGIGPRPVPAGPRRRRRRAAAQTGTFVATPGSMITKCPSKYDGAEHGDARHAWPSSAARRSLVTLGLCALRARRRRATPRARGRRRLAHSARNALIAAFGSTLVAAGVLVAGLPPQRLLARVRRRSLEPRPADAVQALGVLGRAGGLAAALAARS